MNQETPALIKGRIGARRCAVQALYQWQMSGQDPNRILSEFVAERELRQADREYFRLLVQEISTHIQSLEEALKNALDRPIAELTPVERAVLWIGAYELKFHPEIPWRVVINEAVELTKLFGAEQAYKYVNGVLDKVARALRSSDPSSRS